MKSDIALYKKLPGVLLPWYRENRRELPWRQDKEPYHIWLSEIMLQQTRVEAVKGYYTRFLQALPTVSDLAKAEDGLLHKLWEGLGYYSRVRNLKKAANVIMEKWNGVFPSTYEDVRSLPGVGEYTAGAICSIAFSLPTPAVDGNVLRVISRITDDETPIDLPAYKKRVRESLEKIYPEDAGAFTQALMELGATVCGPNRKPDCDGCPCRDFCLGRKSNRAGNLPVRIPKKPRRQEEKTVFVFSCQGMYALEKRPEKGLLAGLWQFPNMTGALTVQEALNAAEGMGLHPKEILRRVEREHIFTHVHWKLHGIYIEVKEMPNCFVWKSETQIQQETALPTAFRQFWEI